MQLGKIILSLLMFVSFSFSFDLFGSSGGNNNIGDKAKSIAVNSIQKNIKKITSLKDILNLSYDKLINANLINIPGLFGLGIQCDINKNVPILDPCKLMKPASSKFRLNLGICQIDVGLSNQCIYDFYQNMCQAMLNKHVETPLKRVRASSKDLVAQSNVILKKSGWHESECSLFSSKARMNDIKNSNNIPVSNVIKTYFTPQTVYKYGLTNSGANSIEDTRLQEWKDCMITNAKGKPSDLSKCKTANTKMPKTEYDVEKAVVDGVLAVDDTTIDSMDNDFKNILIYQANYAKVCANSKNPYQCEDGLWNKGFKRADGTLLKPKEIYNKQLEDIEKKNAILTEYIKYATMPDKDIVFYSEDFIDTLPPKIRNEYRRKAQRKMYQRILFQHFIREIGKLEKEAVSIKYDAIKVQSSQFYPQKAMDEINVIVSAFSQTNKK